MCTGSCCINNIQVPWSRRAQVSVSETPQCTKEELELLSKGIYLRYLHLLSYMCLLSGVILSDGTCV
jgi:hypothetical protein